MSTPERDGVSLTHLDEPLFDRAGATKRDLVDYLEAVAGLMLPELRGRPLSVIRVRAGQRPFMQKNLPDYAPPWIRSVTMWAESSRREVRYPLCDDWRTLLWLANQRAVEYHVTLGMAGHLDPVLPGAGHRPAAGGAVRAGGGGGPAGPPGAHRRGPFRCRQDQRVQGAARVRAGRREQRGGGRGDPGRRRPAERLDPALATTAFIKDDREGKVFLDSTRAYGATLAAAYSPRVRPGAGLVPVALGRPRRCGAGRLYRAPAPGLVAGHDAWAGQLPAPQPLDAALVEEGPAIRLPGCRPCTKASGGPAPGVTP